MGGIGSAVGNLVGGVLEATGLVQAPPAPPKAPDPEKLQEDLTREEAMARDRARRARSAASRSGYASTLITSGEQPGLAGTLLGKPGA